MSPSAQHEPHLLHTHTNRIPVRSVSPSLRFCLSALLRGVPLLLKSLRPSTRCCCPAHGEPCCCRNCVCGCCQSCVALTCVGALSSAGPNAQEKMGPQPGQTGDLS
ncbi:hypothetical protein AMECASPLE_011738 [Ameca splendens]|uniref:Uncharacterized protein n=1 Tax=Ameca splendens TaxID=208324 RepID=A0ABV0ZKL6_9TELE